MHDNSTAASTLACDLSIRAHQARSLDAQVVAEVRHGRLGIRVAEGVAQERKESASLRLGRPRVGFTFGLTEPASKARPDVGPF